MLSQGETVMPEHLPVRPRKKTKRSDHPMMTLRDGNKQIIEATLKDCGGNVSKTARQLKIARSTLYRKMAEFGISSAPH